MENNREDDRVWILYTWGNEKCGIVVFGNIKVFKAIFPNVANKDILLAIDYGKTTTDKDHVICTFTWKLKDHVDICGSIYRIETVTKVLDYYAVKLFSISTSKFVDFNIWSFDRNVKDGVYKIVKHKCTCDSWYLYWYGCKCGGV